MQLINKLINIQKTQSIKVQWNFKHIVMYFIIYRQAISDAQKKEIKCLK